MSTKAEVVNERVLKSYDTPFARVIIPFFGCCIYLDAWKGYI